MPDSRSLRFNDLPAALQQSLHAAMEEQRLPESFMETLETGILPTAKQIAHQKVTKKAPVWGVCGAQGTGKSTLVHFIALILEQHFGLRSITLSLDDFYLSHSSRQQLGRDVHPLFATRGVPGTHDVELGIRTIVALQDATAEDSIALPRFDKATDDTVAQSEWPRVQGPFDVILFEGWCVATQPQPSDHLMQPVNELEAGEDALGSWRDYVNQQLRTRYQQWYALIDHLVLLKVPSFEQVLEWRTLQEEKLRDSYLQRNLPVPDKVMSPQQVRRFIQHYERLTRWNLKTLPDIADVVLELQEDHRISRARFRN